MQIHQFGPVELAAFAFEPDPVSNAPIPAHVVAAVSLASDRSATLLDACVVSVDDAGGARVHEYETIRERHGLPALALAAIGVRAEADALELAAGLPPGWSALVAAFEETWLRGISGAVESAGGRVLADVRIPAAVVNEIAELATDKG